MAVDQQQNGPSEVLGITCERITDLDSLTSFAKQKLGSERLPIRATYALQRLVDVAQECNAQLAVVTLPDRQQWIMCARNSTLVQAATPHLEKISEIGEKLKSGLVSTHCEDIAELYERLGLATSHVWLAPIGGKDPRSLYFDRDYHHVFNSYVPEAGRYESFFDATAKANIFSSAESPEVAIFDGVYIADIPGSYELASKLFNSQLKDQLTVSDPTDAEIRKRQLEDRLLVK